jgi:quercetin dioxygenase-like cupin family protein
MKQKVAIIGTGNVGSALQKGLTRAGYEGRPTVTLKTGDVLFIPAGTIHSAKNVGNGNAAELATYVVEKGQPLIALVSRQ